MQLGLLDEADAVADMQGLFPKKIRILKPTFSERFQIVRANSLTQVHASGRVLTSSRRLNRTVLVKNLHLRVFRGALALPAPCPP